MSSSQDMNNKIARVRELCALASEGPWTPCTCSLKGPCDGIDGVQLRFCTEGRQAHDKAKHDNALAAKSRTLLPALADDAEKMLGLLLEAREKDKVSNPEIIRDCNAPERIDGPLGKKIAEFLEGR